MPDAHKGVRLHVRVPQSKKEGWMDSLDDDETLTSLVTDAVDKELSNEYVHVETLEEVTGQAATDVDFTEITERLDDLQGTVDSLHREFDTVAQSGSSFDPDRVAELGMDLIEHIPPYYEQGHVPDTGLDDREAKLDAVKADLRERPVRECTVEGLAAAVGEGPSVVRQALLHVEQRTTADVGSVVVDGVRYWVRL